jgi:hypothetical protein
MEKAELQIHCELLAKILNAIPKEDWEDRLLIKILPKSPIKTWMLFIDKTLYIKGSTIESVTWEEFSLELREHLIYEKIVDKNLLLDYCKIYNY